MTLPVPALQCCIPFANKHSPKNPQMHAASVITNPGKLWRKDKTDTMPPIAAPVSVSNTPNDTTLLMKCTRIPRPRIDTFATATNMALHKAAPIPNAYVGDTLPPNDSVGFETKLTPVMLRHAEMPSRKPRGSERKIVDKIIVNIGSVNGMICIVSAANK